MNKGIISSLSLLLSLFVLFWIGDVYSGLGLKVVKGGYNLSEERSFSEFPLIIRDEHFSIRGRMEVSVEWFHSNRFTVQPDNCLDDLVVNGSSLRDLITVPCSFPNGIDIDLGTYLKPGLNEIEFGLSNSGGPGGLQIRISNTDLKLLLVHLITLIAILTLSGVLISISSKTGKKDYHLIVFLVGVGLRCIYLASTPHNVRAHDWNGHYEYIQYVANNWSIPKTADGWEFYHPPLYYFLGAVTVKIGELLGHSGDRLLLDLQILSLLLSIGALWIGLLICRELFSESKIEGVLFLSVLATFPGLIFFGSRINNDVLFLFLSFFAVYYMIKWWKDSSTKNLVFHSIILALGLLTKNNTLLLIPALYLSLLLKPKTSIRKKLSLGLFSVFLIAILTGWLTVIRYIQDKDLSIIGNVKTLNSSLIVSNDLSSFVTFNPVRILTVPFNDPWEDKKGRQYFFEYLFRSNFFGEFNFGQKFEWLAHVLYILGMISLLFILMGLTFEIQRNPKSLPVALILFFGIALHLVHRARNPFSSVQDFRFVPFLAVPLTYFCVKGSTYLKYPFREGVGFIVAGISIFSAVLILMLYMEKIPFFI